MDSKQEQQKAKDHIHIYNTLYWFWTRKKNWLLVYWDSVAPVSPSNTAELTSMRAAAQTYLLENVLLP